MKFFFNGKVMKDEGMGDIRDREGIKNALPIDCHHQELEHQLFEPFSPANRYDDNDEMGLIFISVFSCLFLLRNY